ncbi:MAG: M12 family metallo-peptidase [Bacteroidia bacterium]
MKKILFHLSLFCCISFFASANLNAATPAFKLFDLAKQQDVSFKKYISDYALITLNKNVLQEIYQSKSENIAVEIPLSASQVITVNLKKSRVLSDAFIISTPEGNVQYTPGIYYHGGIDGIKTSTGSFSFFNNSVMGIMSIERGNYVIGTTDSKNPASTEYIVYNDADMLVQNPFECHVADDRSLPTGVQNKGGDPGTQTATCRLVELYLECDHQMYIDKGSSVTNVVNYVTGFMNEVGLIYSNESISIAIKQIMVWTVADPYPITSSSGALTAFQAHLAGVFNGDLAHLLSTTVNNLGGVSYVDVLCNQQYGVGYSNIYNTYNAFPTYSWTVEVVSHEMGHGFGSQHTHWCGWQLTPTVTGPIDTCYTPEGGCYTGPSKPKTGTIMSYCHLTANISFALGFGPIPGNLIRARYNAATCAAGLTGGSVTATSSGAVCTGNTANFTASASAGSVYNWTGPAGFSSALQNPTITNAQTYNAGTYSVTATYTGCTGTVSTSLAVNTDPAPVINAPATNICVGGSVLLSANTGAGFTYQWKKGGIAIAGATSATYFAIGAGNYKVTETAAGGCSKTSAPIVITGPPSGTVTASGSLTFCAGGSVTLTAAAGAGYSYQWKLNNTYITGAISQSYVSSTAGIYKCVVTNAYGCTKLSQPQTVVINCRLSGYASQDISYVVSPNPFVNSFTLNFTNESGASANVKIFDVLGKQIASYQNVATKNGLTAGEELLPGIFIVEVTQGDKRQIIRLVKR